MRHGMPCDTLELEHLIGINACSMQLCKLVDHALTIGCIGHTKPLALGRQHLDLSSAVIDELIDQRGNKELGFGLVDILFKELDKALLAIVKIVRGEAPEVHRHRRVKSQMLHLAIFVGKGDVMVGIVADARTLDHTREQAITSSWYFPP